MIWKVLKNNIKTSQITGVCIGILLGLTILMSALSFYIDIKPIFEDKEGFWKDEYIIINKRINIADTYSQIKDKDAKKPLFSKSEIEELKNLTFIKDIAEFSSCSFEISAHTSPNSPLAGFSTELFFEAVPDEYLDVNFDDWKWEENKKFIPIIMPKTYLNLYNFGFAQSQNLPQIPDGALSMLSFNIIIRGNGNIEKFNSRIVGLSEKINTILVPKSFVEWGNQNFGTKQNPNPGRLIIIANDPSSPELLKYFSEHNYDVNKNSLNNSKALSFLKLATSIVFIIGFVITLLAFSIMIISIQLLLQRNSDNIKKLNILGYSIKEISKPYKRFVILIFSTIFLLSIFIHIFLRNYYLSNLLLLGYKTNSHTFINILLLGLAFVVIIIMFLTYMLHKNVKNIVES